jgi:hypothetical protein
LSSQDVSNVCVGDRAHDRQPQSCPARGAVTGCVGAVEAIEDALTLVCGDARPVVFDDESQVICALTLDP